MSSKHFSDYFMYLVVIALSTVVKYTICGEASISRALDLSIPAWRPLVQNPHLQHYYHQNPQPHLISYTHLDAAHKDEIIEAAKINAKTLKKFNELSAQQPITSYSNPYPIFTQTPVPLAVKVSTSSYHRQPVAAASNVMNARLPFPGKSSALYSTKLNFLGKPELSHHHAHHIHQNSIHQTIATTPKVAGFTKEQGGRVNFHYHHPSFGLSSIFDTTTKRIPMFGSSATPHASTKVHPVMSKLQAHMALAAISQNKMKIAQQHRPSSASNEFSPPSQIVSSYANYEKATRVPAWHHGFPSKNIGLGGASQAVAAASSSSSHHNSDVSQLIMPSVHPSIITPFIEQVQLKAKEAEQQKLHQQKHSQESNSGSSENNGSYEVINDVFSHDLVPPPSASKHRLKEKHPKFNLSMKSPLQDASRFNYENVISTATPGSTSASHHEHKFRPSNRDPSLNSGEKPNVFANLNRSKENVYKHHKQLHPGYNGSPLKKKQHFNQQQEKPPHFLPTPFEASKEVEEIKIDYKDPPHSFFTIEDAVTPHFVDNVKHHNEYNDEFEIITLRPQIKPTYASFTAGPQLFSTSSTTHITPLPQTEASTQSTHKPKGKLRRRKPKPKVTQTPPKESSASDESTTSTYRPPTSPAAQFSSIRTRVKSNNTSTHETELKTRNRLNHPNRVRTRPHFTSPSALATTATDYDFTLNPIEAERKSEVSSTQGTSLEGATSTKSSESLPAKHRVRLRYKNKLNLKSVSNSLEKLSGDNQISDTENENIVVRQPSHHDEEASFTVATENPFNEVKSSLKLPNLKLRNEALTTVALPTVESQTVSSTSSSSGENDENVGINKISRPRFSIKELKRKQYLTSSTAQGSTLSTTLLTSSTSSTTPRPDNQRFNRYRLNFNRRRNETNIESSNEQDNEQPSPSPSTKRRISSTRFSVSTSTTESTLTPSPSKRGNSLPKRTFPVRNFTRPSSDNAETSTSHKPSFVAKSSTNRPSVPSLRQRIQNYKRKEAINEIIEESIKNVNFELDTTIPIAESTTSSTVSTEIPITRETSIMKIAKASQSSSNSMRSTTSNSILEEDTLLPSSIATLSERHDSTDLVGSPSEHSQRVAELTVSANEDSTFKSANIGLLSRRIPNYFTISTDDPILPIQAFFPQIKTNESN